MKNLLLIFVFLASLSGCQEHQDGAVALKDSKRGKEVRVKRYQVPSGMVEYRTSMKGDMGVGTIKGHGTAKLYFKDWGATELQEEQSEKVTETDVFGRKNVQRNRIHRMVKLEDGIGYEVDFDRRTIYKRKDPAIGFVKAFTDGDLSDNMETMLRQNGGRKTGTETVAGYPCDKWELKGARIWIYKDVPLKTEMTMMGITNVKEAVKASFGTKVPDKYFRLPDFPVTDMSSWNDLQRAAGALDEDGEDELGYPDDPRSGMPVEVMVYKTFRHNVLEESPDTKEDEIRQAYEVYKKLLEKYQ